MAKNERPGLDLEIDDATHKREFRLQQVAWVVLALALLAALLGLTGDGPLADARTEREGVELHWDRIVRAKAETQVRVTVPSSHARDNVLSVRIGRRWVEDVEIKSVQPEPERVSVGDDYVEYLFAVPPGATATSVALIIRPHAFGSRELTVRVAEVPVFRVRQFAFP